MGEDGQLRLTADAYGKKAGEALRRSRLYAQLEQEGLAQRVRELGGQASTHDVNRWERRGDYPAWVLMMMYEDAGLSPDHIAALLNHPPSLFERAYGLIRGDARPI
ncbi:MAG: hypothetical protein J2P58_12590 [Acidimicrobiaceae bacterium]|nr:hypothetical protein [Acidimicrobiaceae bacterium]